MKNGLLRRRRGVARVLLYLGLVLACWEVYHYVSLVAPRHTAIAHQHAAALVSLEHRLGILVEPQIQHFTLNHARPRVLEWLLDNAAVRYEAKLIYAGGQIPWLVSMLLWLLLFRSRYVERLCILVIVSSLLGIVFAALYPVAPPRFALAGPPYYMEDVSQLSAPEQKLVRYGGFDPYAAMPSLHVLWGLITALGLFLGTRRWDLRVLTSIFPISIVVTVIITGNHYILDCVASVLLFAACLVGYWLYLRLRRALRPGTVPASASMPSSRYSGQERRMTPNLRPLDFPILLCAVSGLLMILSADTLQRMLGLLLIVTGALSAPVAVLRIKTGNALRHDAPTAEWFSGFLLVAGATTLGAGDLLSRSAGSLCWVAAALLPLLARMRDGTPIAGIRPSTFHPSGLNAADRERPLARANLDLS